MDLSTFFFLALIAVLFCLCHHWCFSRSAAILNQWAEESGHEILEKSFCLFCKGPFFWCTSRNQVVYRVIVRDKAGNIGRGWVACGSWWRGLFSNQAQVRWDARQPRRRSRQAQGLLLNQANVRATGAPQPAASTMHNRWLVG
jgi:hypothetical protein